VCPSKTDIMILPAADFSKLIGATPLRVGRGI
jgi:hypothetical protein